MFLVVYFTEFNASWDLPLYVWSLFLTLYVSASLIGAAAKELYIHSWTVVELSRELSQTMNHKDITSLDVQGPLGTLMAWTTLRHTQTL